MSLLACLLFDPVLAGAQRVASDSALAHAAASQSEGGEESPEELAGGEEEAQTASNTENEEEGVEESEEGEANTASGHRARRCVVPALEGESLSVARAALSRAHCKLGKISEPRLRHGGLVVVGQGKSSGRHLRGGSQIAVRLGSSTLKGRHHR